MPDWAGNREYAGGGKALGGVEKAISNWPADNKMLYADALWHVAKLASAKSESSGSPLMAEVVGRALNGRDPATRYPPGNNSVKLTILAWLLLEKLLDLAVLRYLAPQPLSEIKICRSIGAASSMYLSAQTKIRALEHAGLRGDQCCNF